MKKVTCDFSKTGKPIRPHHSMCNYPPRPQTLEAYRGAPDEKGAALIRSLLKDIDPPFTRLKYPRMCGHGKSIEISSIFRDWDKDENDPDSYYFYSTDMVIKDSSANGRKIVFRLGVPRELYDNALYVDVKKKISYDKLATVCSNIVRHVNGRWNRGISAKVKYWEIWDKPDEKYSFRGSPEDYYELYAAIATRLKSEHPHLKVGGPSPSDCSDLTFMKGFLEYVKKHDLPLDFVSWHFTGEDVNDAEAQALAIKRLVHAEKLEKRCKIICTEWNCLTIKEDGRFSVPHARDIYGASFDAAFMITMQKLNMDMSFFFDCTRNAPWASFIYPGFFRPYKPLYVFPLYAKLYKLGKSAKTTIAGRDLYSLAATDGKKKALLVSSCSDKPNSLEISGFDGKKRVYVLDGDRDLTLIAETSDDTVTVPLKGRTVCFVESV